VLVEKDRQDQKVIGVVMEHLDDLVSLDLKAIPVYLARRDGKELG